MDPLLAGYEIDRKAKSKARKMDRPAFRVGQSVYINWSHTPQVIERIIFTDRFYYISRGGTWGAHQISTTPPPAEGPRSATLPEYVSRVGYTGIVFVGRVQHERADYDVYSARTDRDTYIRGFSINSMGGVTDLYEDYFDRTCMPWSAFGRLIRGATRRCSVCHQPGHDRRTCANRGR